MSPCSDRAHRFTTAARSAAAVILSGACLTAGAVLAEPPANPPAASTADSPFVASPLQQMVDQARGRAAEYAAHPPVIGAPLSAQDKLQVQRLADAGRQRGQAEYQALVNGKNSVAPRLAPDRPAQEEKVFRAPGLVVVALSSSMPEAMLRDYFTQLDAKPATVVVLRGFVDGPDRVKPTAQWLEKTLRKDPTCNDRCKHFHVAVEIDPLVYRSLGITQVPALTYLPGVHALKHCDGETFSSAGLVTGAASMQASLQALAKTGVAVPQSIQAIYEVKGWEARPQ